MLGFILIGGIFILSIFEFIEGIKIISSNPLNLIYGILFLILLNLVMLFTRAERVKTIDASKSAFLDQLSRNPYSKFISLAILWVLLIPIFASGWHLAQFPPGPANMIRILPFVPAIFITFIAYLILRGKEKS